ncbi:hypothetical protein B0H14DRAFT_2653381 [Mycena olivaceomarginata]|nr:hypothetical protein B0H14DRAFT_2653381 [Mycena olivaceomarginata]
MSLQTGAPIRAALRDGTRVETVSESMMLLEEEYKRICRLQAHTPWAENKFAKYLSVEPMPDADAAPEAYVELTGAEGIVRKLSTQQRARLQQQVADRYWNETLAAARQTNRKMATQAQPQTVSASDLRRERDEAAAGRWALRHLPPVLRSPFGCLTASTMSATKLSRYTFPCRLSQTVLIAGFH